MTLSTFVRQAEQLGLDHVVMCAERAVSGDPFAVLLSDDFLTDYAPSFTTDLAQAFASGGKSQLSVMEVGERDIPKYGVFLANGVLNGVAGLVEKLEESFAPSNLARIGLYILESSIFDFLRGLAPGSGSEFQLADAINQLAQSGAVESVPLNGRRYDCGSVQVYVAAIRDEA